MRLELHVGQIGELRRRRPLPAQMRVRGMGGRQLADDVGEVRSGKTERVPRIEHEPQRVVCRRCDVRDRTRDRGLVDPPGTERTAPRGEAIGDAAGEIEAIAVRSGLGVPLRNAAPTDK